MKLLLTSLLLLSVVQAQEISLNQTNGTNLVTIDAKTYAVPDMSKMPWFGENKLGTINIDTIKVTLVIGQIRTSTTVYNSGNLQWKNGYYIPSTNKFLDHLKEPISSLYRVFTTLPGFW